MGSCPDASLYIEVCLNCPYPDCIDNGQNICPLIGNQENTRCNDILDDIENVITKNGPIKTKELRQRLLSKYGCTKVIVNNMIQSNKLKVIRIGKGRNSIKVVGVEHDRISH